MPKRKKYPKLPSGWGSIRYLGKGRRNPYAVHPPATECSENGHYIQPKAICYVSDWYVGFAVLNSYRAGTYKPGDEIELSKMTVSDGAVLDGLIERILKDSNMAANLESSRKGKTFSEVYDDFYEWKFGKFASKKLSESTKLSIEFGYKNLKDLHDRPFAEIKLDEMQKVLDEYPLGFSSVKQMLNLLKQIYDYADARELCERNYAKHLVMPNKKECESGVPFSEEQIETMWKNKDNPVIEMTLIACYSGFRVTAYASMEEVNLEEKYFKGGIKTKSSKGRTVPIHSAIYPLVARRIKRDGKLLNYTSRGYNGAMKRELKKIGITGHTTHDCRHTFSMLCEKYGVNENDRKRMMGHSFGSDITNQIYGHRSLEDLRKEIEKIQVPDFVTSCDK